MFPECFLCFLAITVAAAGKMARAAPPSDFVLVPRDEWHAKPPKLIEPMPNPVPFVVIHHSYIPAACHTAPECIQAMQWMQDYHQINNSWNDIGYHFAVGGDGRAYVGRGWSRVGAHAPNYNNISIGICVIGDWRMELPPQQQLDTVRKLVEFGVEEGMIEDGYKLVGHRQVREGTTCPGDTLFEEISTWDHFYDGVLKKVGRLDKNHDANNKKSKGFFKNRA